MFAVPGVTHRSHMAVEALTLLTLNILLISFPSTTTSANVLLMVGVSSKSHMNFLFPISEGLQSRGHTLTVVSPYIDEENYPNLPQVELTEIKNFLEDSTKFLMNAGVLRLLYAERQIIPRVIKMLYTHPFVKELFKKKSHYDLIITDITYNDMILPIAHHLNIKVVYISTGILDVWSTTIMNVPTPYAYVPIGFLQFSEVPSFLQRLTNTVLFLVSNIYIVLRMHWTDASVAQYLPNAPPFDDLRKNVSLLLVNSDIVGDNPRPSVPNVINIGGIQCRDPRPLPKYLEEFIESSGDHGFILFSMGSILKGHSWPNATKKAFAQAFSKLKQNVIWKYEEPIDGLSDNVLLTKWSPQQDLLGHPKIRVFISHGGFLGVQEALYHGVPIIGMPMFSKQPMHIARAVELGYAEQLNFHSVTEEKILEKINLILKNPRYKESVAKYSSIFRDRPASPMDTALFWIEYVIRHKGAHHLSTSAKYLSLWQCYLIDVVAVIILALIILYLIIRFIVKYVIRCLRLSCQSEKSKSLNKKHQ